MLTTTFNPSFSDTDALGHVNNAKFVTWFEDARRPVFELFVPDLDPKKWNLIIARIEVDFLAQGYFQKETTVTTTVEKIGNSSFVLIHEAIQDNKPICRGKAFMVHFNYTTQKSERIPDEIRKSLEAFLLK
jgi:acyl-CoA thioester hydrolase